MTIGIKGFPKGNQLGRANAGRKRIIPPEHRAKLSAAAQRRKERDGYINSPEARAKLAASRTGIKHSEESRRRMSESQKARPTRPPVPPEVGRKISAAKMGKSNYKIKGANCHLWKGGITPENRRIRTSLEYKAWRRAVFERDGYLCVIGGKAHGHKLQADHILPFSQHPELRLEVSNGRTLCVECHRATETWGRPRAKAA